MYRRSCTPSLLEKKPEAVRSRKLLKNATPAEYSDFAFFGQAMSSSTAARSTDSGAHRNAVASGATANNWTASRRFMAATCPPWVPRRRSQGPLLHLVRDVIARPHRQREDGPRGVLVGLRHERPAVRYEQVLAVVRLAPAVQHRRPGVVAHARPAELVDDGPAGREPVSLFGGRHRREHLASHLGDQRPEGLLHVLRLLVFVVRPLPVEPQHGDPPPVHGARIDLAIAVVIRDHLAAAREADRGAVVAAVVGLWLFSVAPSRRGGGRSAPESLSPHVRAPPPLAVVDPRGGGRLRPQAPQHAHQHD